MMEYVQPMKLDRNFGILPPSVTEMDEEPSVAGGWQYGLAGWPAPRSRTTGVKVMMTRTILPPPVTLSDEEPIAAGGRRL